MFLKKCSNQLYIYYFFLNEGSSKSFHSFAISEALVMLWIVLKSFQFLLTVKPRIELAFVK